MRPFVPDRVYFEPGALTYRLGEEIYERVKEMGCEILQTTSHNQVTGIPGTTELQKYRNAKRTLVVGVRKTLKFDSSKPSAEYAIPISTGCIGHCHYCYLQTTLGAKPYIRVYVNMQEILAKASEYIEERVPNLTRFEAACTSDPLSTEHLTGNLGRLIRFMADQEHGRLRFVTKYDLVDPLLTTPHNDHTRFRFSMNADHVVKNFEPSTATLDERLHAAEKVANAGYPLGFIIAPIYLFDGWKEEYTDLFHKLASRIHERHHHRLTFELIQHRFTRPAKRVIEERYPKSKLVMEEDERLYKWGRYGIGKYVYPKDKQEEIQRLFHGLLEENFPTAKIEYFT